MEKPMALPLPKITANLDVLIDPATLQARITALAAEIEKAYQGRELVLLGVLKGSLPFMADLMRQIDLPCSIDFLGLSSYGDKTESSGVVRITSDLSKPVEGKDVLVIEDIVDTGLTMGFLLENLKTRKPASVRICTLLHKPARTKVQVPLDYVGFTIEDKFVVGYGLDYAEKFRNVPWIGVVRGT